MMMAASPQGAIDAPFTPGVRIVDDRGEGILRMGDGRGQEHASPLPLLGLQRGKTVEMRQKPGESTRIGLACVATARARVASMQERVDILKGELSERKAHETESLTFWFKVASGVYTIEEDRHAGKPQSEDGAVNGATMMPQDDPRMVRLASRLAAAGPSPSSVLDQIEARGAGQEGNDEHEYISIFEPVLLLI